MNEVVTAESDTKERKARKHKAETELKPSDGAECNSNKATGRGACPFPSFTQTPSRRIPPKPPLSRAELLVHSQREAPLPPSTHTRDARPRLHGLHRAPGGAARQRRLTAAGQQQQLSPSQAKPPGPAALPELGDGNTRGAPSSALHSPPRSRPVRRRAA